LVDPQHELDPQHETGRDPYEDEAELGEEVHYSLPPSAGHASNHALPAEVDRDLAWCTDQGCGRTDPYPCPDYAVRT
jgi:hypothetical protein